MIKNGRESGTVHATLRQATARAHRTVDRHPLLRRLLASELGRAGYAESLMALYRPHSELEERVLRHPNAPASGLVLAPRAPLLLADLADLGRPLAPTVVSPHPLPDEDAAWWGRLYVLEGSRLGSAVIARRVRAVLGDSVPLRFFEHGAESFSTQCLFAALERALSGPDALDRAVDSARTAFGQYRDSLDAFVGAAA